MGHVANRAVFALFPHLLRFGVISSLLATRSPRTLGEFGIVGAGLVGLATARELLGRGHRVTIFEAADRIAPHQSSHNSGVIHAGIYYAPGSLKARLAVSGARALYAYCEERGVEARRCGKLIVATSADQLGGLDALERRGRANGVRLARVRPEDVEPHVRGVAALHSPDTGVVDYAAVAAALAEDVRGLGGDIRLGERVTRTSGRMIVCAGAWSDVLAPSRDVRVLPFRGAYRILRRPELVRALVYPVPDPALPFLGVHLTRGIDDEVHVGPTALLVGARDAYALRRLHDLRHVLGWPGTWRMARRWWRTAATEVGHAAFPRTLARAAQAFVPALRPRGPRPRAGRRARAGGRTRRDAARRLPARRGGRRAARPQRPLPRRDGLSRPREGHRRCGLTPYGLCLADTRHRHHRLHRPRARPGPQPRRA